MTFGGWNSLSLGLDRLHNLTTGTPTRYEVRVDLQTANESAYAVYNSFQVASSRERYKLSVGKYSGTAGEGQAWSVCATGLGWGHGPRGRLRPCSQMGIGVKSNPDHCKIRTFYVDPPRTPSQ